MKRDVGMMCQKYINKEGYNNIQSPVPTVLWKDVGMDEVLQVKYVPWSRDRHYFISGRWSRESIFCSKIHSRAFIYKLVLREINFGHYHWHLHVVSGKSDYMYQHSYGIAWYPEELLRFFARAEDEATSLWTQPRPSTCSLVTLYSPACVSSTVR